MDFDHFFFTVCPNSPISADLLLFYFSLIVQRQNFNHTAAESIQMKKSLRQKSFFLVLHQQTILELVLHQV